MAEVIYTVSHPNQFKGKARVTLSLKQKQQPGQEVCLQEQVSKIQARREDPLAHYHLCVSYTSTSDTTGGRVTAEETVP